ncbi:MAG: CarD family transcriptional regulator [Methylobacteriaceae bacterium]|nr:CarD family transcriptional regulator [Methylobacteriaceae bacterium]
MKAAEPVVAKVKEMAADAKNATKAAVAAVTPAPAAKTTAANTTAANTSAADTPATKAAETKAAAGKASAAKAAAAQPSAAKTAPAKAAAPKAAARPEASASTILLETIRRVGQAAAKAKARVVAPAKAVVASVVSAPAAERPEAAKPVAPDTPAPVQASAPSAPAAAQTGFASAPAGRPGFPGGDARLHHLQPRPVAKPTGARPSFKLEEFIVYPAHGVGQIVAIEEQEVAGFKLELYVISFAKDKMTLKVPTPKVVSVGMRKLAEPPLVQKALDVLTGRARIKRTMWSRRAQEYEAKINSGDLIAIAEVIRDLYRSEAQPEQSYSERQLYEAALDRMAREIGAVQKMTETETLKLIDTQLQKGPRRGAKPEGEGEAEGEPEVEEAAA